MTDPSDFAFAISFFHYAADAGFGVAAVPRCAAEAVPATAATASAVAAAKSSHRRRMDLETATTTSSSFVRKLSGFPN